MFIFTRHIQSFILGALLLVTTAAAVPKVPSGIDHSPWNALLAEYVDERGLVDYRRWKANPKDLDALNTYLLQFAPPPENPAPGDEKIASLINAYNAFTVQFILGHYPTESIRLLDQPFEGVRHRIGGEQVSLDAIEHQMLRPLIGWKVHSVLVCAARSCPPLLKRAYRSESWEEQMEERYRTWLAREDLNTYDTGRFRKAVEISKIFSWYGEDFTGDHTVDTILRRYGPESYREFLTNDYRITYKNYHWGLNDQSDLGKDYKHHFLRSIF